MVERLNERINTLIMKTVILTKTIVDSKWVLNDTVREM